MSKKYNNSSKTNQVELQAKAVNKLIRYLIELREEQGKKPNRLLTFLIIVLLIAAAILFIYNYISEFSDGIPAAIDNNTAQVHYIDVGQGDCSLLVADDGTAVLIDCGEKEYSSDVLNYLDNLGITRLEYVVITHPHSDHMGGMSNIISSDIEVGTVIMPVVAQDYEPTTLVYERLLKAIANKDCDFSEAKTGCLPFGNGTIEIITTGYLGDNYNNYSPVIRFVYGDRAFLFTGDAETNIECDILDMHCDIRADVYNAGHHGSSTSSSPEFVAAINPQYFVISCGAGNSYGHPHRETMALFKEYSDYILRTDIHGDIVFTTDGENLEYYTQY